MERHPSVMTREVLQYLQPVEGGRYIDATCGTAGHSLALLQAAEGSRVLAIERDPDMAERARRRIAQEGIGEERFELVEGSYAALGDILAVHLIDRVDGCLFDLGASALHFHVSGRGFSLRGADEPLDMRFDPHEGEPASNLLQRLPEQELADLIFHLGDERWSRRIARRIIETRRERPLRTAGDLAELVERAIPRRHWPPDIHPATRVFQALRIAVNEEFEQIEAGIPQAIDALKPGGRIAAISFHSGEDRRVKNIFRDAAGRGSGDPITGRRPAPRIEILTKKPVSAGAEEIERNPGARSAKLRAAEKLQD